MAFLGLTPGEHSSGGSVRPRGITKAGNGSVRRLLYEAAWSYRLTPKVGSHMQQHMPRGISQEVKDIAWKAQLRLCKRYRQLLAGQEVPGRDHGSRQGTNRLHVVDRAACSVADRAGNGADGLVVSLRRAPSPAR